MALPKERTAKRNMLCSDSLLYPTLKSLHFKIHCKIIQTFSVYLQFQQVEETLHNLNMRLIDKYLPSDYSDSVSRRFRPAGTMNADYIFEEMFCNFPKPVAWLFKLRDAIVKPLGLQVGGGFRKLVSERNNEEIIVCKNDKHLYNKSKNEMNTWKLTSFDLFSLGMTIKGAWIYKELPEASVLQASLDAVLQPYPQLLGRYDAKRKSMIWNGQEEPIGLTELDCPGHSVAEDMYTLVPKFNANSFKDGKSRALEAYRITLDNGAAIVLQGAHALMDGCTFYRIADDWGKMTSGIPVEAMMVDQDLIPHADALTKEQTVSRVQQLGWSMIGLKSIFRMLFNMATMKLIKETFTLEVSQDEISRMRNESGAGTNAVLCHYAISKFLEKMPKKKIFTLLEVADFRGRACEMPKGFCGNFSQPVVIGDFGRDVTAADIQKAASAKLNDKEALSENVQLSVSSTLYGLPYFMFDASDMNSPNPKLFYVNNQLKMKACHVNFGTGLPLRAQQAMLPDMIKFWQPQNNGPVQIIYGGYAAKIMRRKQQD